MLPTWANQGYFSLQNNRPAITFSSRVDKSGKVLETKIQPSILRNVISITPSEVATLLGDHSTVKTNKLVVGGEAPQGKERRPPTISPSQLQDLRDLYTAAQGLWNVRKAAGGIRVVTGSANVRLFENTNQAGLTWNPPSLDRARLIRGDPVIEVTSTIPTGFMQLGIGPRNIVEEMMMLAGRSAATWCSERHIPVMYRGTVQPPSNDSQSIEQMKATLYSSSEPTVALSLALRYMRALGRAIAHFAPIPHRVIGVPAYVKVTSPLRRFSDMIAHWQIEAAVRYEAQTGKKFDANELAKTTPRSILPFSQSQMEEAIVTLSPRERIIQSTTKQSEKFWLTLAFLRAFKYNEAPLPSVFKYWIQGQGLSVGGETLGHLPDYGVSARMVDVPDVREGDEWEVALHRIDVFERTIYVKPIRLINRTEDASWS
jgi:exoribonuclease R